MMKQHLRDAHASIALALNLLDDKQPENIESKGLTPYSNEWTFPVGSIEFPAKDWYCATWHDLTGRRNGGYQHPGIDLNVWTLPRGDVDRGQQVYAVAGGVIVEHSYHHDYLGSTIIKVDFAPGVPLWIRYWHLAQDSHWVMWDVGKSVVAGDTLGVIGNYQLGAGGDHLHFDMAMTPFKATWWWTSHPEVEWVDPVFVLKAKLDPVIVAAMLTKG